MTFARALTRRGLVDLGLIGLLQTALWLGGCTAEVASEAVATTAETAQTVVTDALLPAVVTVREAVETIVPPEPATGCRVHPAAVDLIVRFEVTSPSYYTARLQAPIWPGASSGVTWGIGYDGGHQTRGSIALDWQMHTQVSRLLGASGIIGPPAKALLPGLSDVRTAYPMASDVFALSTLPTYCELTARTFRVGWDALDPIAQGTLVATVYNRGAGMIGESRSHMRALRDDCVPRADYGCMAAQYRAMHVVWIGKPVHDGLQNRYNATARLVESI